MEINWFTVIAQVVNFLILVWLLKRFLYKPILNAIEERENKIAAQLQDAEAQKAQAHTERELFQQKNKTFDEERTAKMNEIHEEANVEKQRLFEGVRNESSVLRLKYEESLEQEGLNLANTLRRKTKEEVFAIAGKALADLADAGLEEQAVKIFTEKIQALEGEGKTLFKSAFDNNDRTIIVKSAFELSTSSKTRLEKAVEEITGRAGAFRYLLQPELVSGIEMETGSYQLSWNIESYLDSLKRNETTKENENAGF